MYYDPDFDDVTRRVQTKLAMLFPQHYIFIKLSFYMAQLYENAKDFCTNLERFEQWDGHEAWLAEITRLREIAKSLRHFSSLLVDEYDLLEPFLENKAPEETLETSQRIVETYQVRQRFQNLLEQMGCSERVCREITDDAWDLYGELVEIIFKIEKLISIPSPNNGYLTSVLADVVYPWSHMRWHAAYHLGEYEESTSHFYHAGFLGWSLILLEELSQSLRG